MNFYVLQCKMLFSNRIKMEYDKTLELLYRIPYKWDIDFMNIIDSIDNKIFCLSNQEVKELIYVLLQDWDWCGSDIWLNMLEKIIS